MWKLTTALLIGAIALFGGFFVLSGIEGSDSQSYQVDPSKVASVPPMDISAPAQVETATFAMGCFWSPDALFGSTPGVVRTRVGYSGGTEENPTYREIGGHTETVQIEYDPKQISYGELLDIFWKNHNAEYPQFLRQYKSIIFYHNMEQRQLANQTKVEMEAKLNKTLHTEIKSFTNFYLAESYHQKHFLRQEEVLIKEFKAMYPNESELLGSTAAARVNGYIAGYGDPSNLQDELNSLGLTETSKGLLIETHNKRKAVRYR